MCVCGGGWRIPLAERKPAAYWRGMCHILCEPEPGCGNVPARHPETQKLAINFSSARAEPNGKWVKDSLRSDGSTRLDSARHHETFAVFLCVNLVQLKGAVSAERGRRCCCSCVLPIFAALQSQRSCCPEKVRKLYGNGSRSGSSTGNGTAPAPRLPPCNIRPTMTSAVLTSATLCCHPDSLSAPAALGRTLPVAGEAQSKCSWRAAGGRQRVAQEWKQKKEKESRERAKSGAGWARETARLLSLSKIHIRNCWLYCRWHCLSPPPAPGKGQLQCALNKRNANLSVFRNVFSAFLYLFRPTTNNKIKYSTLLA